MGDAQKMENKEEQTYRQSGMRHMRHGIQHAPNSQHCPLGRHKDVPIGAVSMFFHQPNPLQPSWEHRTSPSCNRAPPAARNNPMCFFQVFSNEFGIIDDVYVSSIGACEKVTPARRRSAPVPPFDVRHPPVVRRSMQNCASEAPWWTIWWRPNHGVKA